MNIIDAIYFQSPWIRDNEFRPREAHLMQRDLFESFFQKVSQTKQIVSVTGIRRVGKTTLLKQAISKLLETVPTSEVLYFSFDQPAIIRETQTLEDILLIFIKEILGTELHKIDRRIYIFLDEIQLIPYWQDILKRFYDANQNLKFVISGSASLFLLTKSKESLAGRIFSITLPPLSFSEYKRFSSRNDFIEFLNFGQFPELFEIADNESKQEYLAGIVNKVLEVDIVKLYGVRKVTDFERLFWSLLPNTGQVIKSTKMMSELGLKKATFFRYLQILEGSFLINKVLNLSGSFRSESRLLRKIYPAAANFLSLAIEPIAASFKAETYLASQLSSFGKVYLFRQREKEIDFILPDKKVAIELKFQDSLHKSDYKTLVEYCGKKGYKPVLVTRSYSAQAAKSIPKCVALAEIEQFLETL